MKIRIGLPSTIPHVSGTLLQEWAKRANEGDHSQVLVFRIPDLDQLHMLTKLMAE